MVYTIYKSDGIRGLRGRRMTNMYPFENMQVGNAFDIPLEGRNPVGVQSAVIKRAKIWASKNDSPAKFYTSFRGDHVVCARYY